MQKPFIIAHRGASALAPENTFAAFRRAIDCGAEGLEFDVQLSKDDVPMVIHDFDLKRLGGRADFVKDLTAEELQKIDVGSWFNRRHKEKADANFANETIPSFGSLLDFLSESPAVAGGLTRCSEPSSNDFKDKLQQPATAGGSDFLLYVELKFADDVVEKSVEKVCEMIAESKFLPNVKLKSFNLKAVKYAKETFPQICTVALFEPQFKTVFRKRTAIFDAAEVHLADEISLHYSLATRKTVETAKQRNLPVTIWTVEQTVWVKRAADFGLEAIISNNPARLLVERNNQNNER